MNSRSRHLLPMLLLLSQVSWGMDWISLTPNPAYSRDLAMGASTLALMYAPQDQSINPAGFTAFSTRNERSVTVFFDPGGVWRLREYAMHEADSRGADDPITAPFRLLVHTIALRWRTATLAGIFGEPVMMNDDRSPYTDYEASSGLESHQNSILLGLNLHPRVSVAGRVDRYYHYSDPQGEGYSYGVILRPKNFDIGVEYQRFPASGIRVWHPLDRRTDQSVSAGIAFGGRNWTVTSQMNNLAMASDSAELEPRIGAEWRPWQHLGLRGGLISFSDAERWAWTSGISLLDANAFHSRAGRLSVPDDVVQFAVAVQYDRRTPQVGMASLTLSWRL